MKTLPALIEELGTAQTRDGRTYATLDFQHGGKSYHTESFSSPEFFSVSILETSSFDKRARVTAVSVTGVRGQLYEYDGAEFPIDLDRFLTQAKPTGLDTNAQQQAAYITDALAYLAQRAA